MVSLCTSSLDRFNASNNHIAEMRSYKNLGSGGVTRGGSSPAFRTKNLCGGVGYDSLGGDHDTPNLASSSVILNLH